MHLQSLNQSCGGCNINIFQIYNSLQQKIKKQQICRTFHIYVYTLQLVLHKLLHMSNIDLVQNAADLEAIPAVKLRAIIVKLHEHMLLCMVILLPQLHKNKINEMANFV